MELKRLESPAPAALIMFEEDVVGTLLDIEAAVFGSLFDFFGDGVESGSN